MDSVDSKGVRKESPLGCLRSGLLPINALRQQAPSLANGDKGIVSLCQLELACLLCISVGRTPGTGSVQLFPNLCKGVDEWSGRLRIKHNVVWLEPADPGNAFTTAGSPDINIARRSFCPRARVTDVVRHVEAVQRTILQSSRSKDRKYPYFR